MALIFDSGDPHQALPLRTQCNPDVETRCNPTSAPKVIANQWVRDQPSTWYDNIVSSVLVDASTWIGAGLSRGQLVVAATTVLVGLGATLRFVRVHCRN